MQILFSGSVLSLFLQVLPAALFAGLLFAFLRIRHQKKRGISVRQSRELLLFFFVCVQIQIFCTDICKVVNHGVKCHIIYLP